MPRIQVPPMIALLAVLLSAIAASASSSPSGGSGHHHLSFDLELYTSDALSIGGGAFVSMSECSFITDQDDSNDDDDGENDGEDDDDDDDGHSSMLSNASLRRKRMTSGASSPSSFFEPNHPNRSGSSGIHNVRQQPRVAGPAFSLKERKFQKTSRKSALDAAISIRGGASAAAKDPAELTRRLFVAALVTISYEFVLGHLLEFVKIGVLTLYETFRPFGYGFMHSVMQTSPEGTSYSDVIKSITGEKGFVGIWDGFVPWGVVQSILKGGVFGLAHAAASGFLKPMAEDGKIPMIVALCLAGAFGGLFQGYVLSPTLLLKTRVMTNDVFREKMTLIKSTWLSLTIGFDVVRNEGLLALMKGSNVFAMKRTFDWATRFIFSDMFEAILLKFSTTGTLTTGEKVVASLMGGTLSTLSTLPLDVLVAKSQDAKKAGEAVSAWDMFQAELEEKGWNGLAKSYMNGFEARLAHVCLTTIVMKTFAPIVYDRLYGNK